LNYVVELWHRPFAVSDTAVLNMVVISIQYGDWFEEPRIISANYNPVDHILPDLHKSAESTNGDNITGGKQDRKVYSLKYTEVIRAFFTSHTA
jgi:hypothetical protein